MTTSLDEFAATPEAERKRGPVGYMDTLPEDVQRQLLESSAGHAAATRWLHAEGFDRANAQMVSHWRYANGWGQ